MGAASGSTKVAVERLGFGKWMAKGAGFVASRIAGVVVSTFAPTQIGKVGLIDVTLTSGEKKCDM